MSEGGEQLGRRREGVGEEGVEGSDRGRTILVVGKRK